MAYLAPFYQPLPTMYLSESFPEKRTHRQHHFPFPWWGHKVGRWVHDPDVQTHIPTTDVRETQSHYYLDVELPGLKDKSKLNIRWTSTRTLLVQASIERPHLPDCKNMTEEHSATAVKYENSDPSSQNPRPCDCFGEVQKQSLLPQPDLTSTESSDKRETDEARPTAPSAHLTVPERHIGYFIRNFTFPIDVESEEMKATLEAGLLTLAIAKKHDHRVAEGKGEVVVQ